MSPIDIPVHLVRTSRDRKVVCGRRTDEKNTPTVLIRWARQHMDGWGMEVCSDCLSIVTEEGITL